MLKITDEESTVTASSYHWREQETKWK
jgi:hypothetical protein